MAVDKAIDSTTETKLTPRQREILKFLVQEHTVSAAPIGSGTIQRIGQMGVSSATIRNELIILEELGYLAQPHTSAGRVPTVKGYRYFVEHLMEQGQLPVPEQRMIRHQFHQIRLDLDQWMRLTAAVLAHTAQSASLVTPPRATTSRFRHLELISINDSLSLMILVLQDSSVHQEMLVASTPIDQHDLTRASNKLNALLSDQSEREIGESTNPQLANPEGWEAQVLQRVSYAMQQADRRAISEIYRDGLMNVFRQPEFEDAERLRRLVRIVERRGFLEPILAKTLQANGVQIIIGGEGAYEGIYDVSLVLSPYGIRDIAGGVLGIMGPTRMAYGRAISAVRYVAHLMNGLIAEVHGA